MTSEQTLSERERSNVAATQRSVLEASQQAATAAKRAAQLTNNDWPTMALLNTRSELREAYDDMHRAFSSVENTLERLDHSPREETTGEIVDDHAERYDERYDDPVRIVAIELMQKNRWEWLVRKPSTQGAETVKRHGLTKNQRKWLDQLQEALEEYDAE